jgi:hypothetical protein
MNCAQCQQANGPEATYCGNCGASLAPAAATRVVPAASAAVPPPPPAPSGYAGPTGYPGPSGYAGPSGYEAPSGYQGPSGNAGPSGYAGPGNAGPAGNGGPSGYGGPQGQYQPGQAGPIRGGASALPPVKWDLTRLTKIDKIVAGATLVTMISLWLPWYTAKYSELGVTSSGSVSGTSYHGWLWLEFILALALIGYIAARAAWDTLPVRLPVPHETVLIAATGLQFLLILIAFIAVPSTHGLANYSVGWGFGAFLALIASLVAAGPVIYPAVKPYLNRRGA